MRPTANTFGTHPEETGMLGDTLPLFFPYDGDATIDLEDSGLDWEIMEAALHSWN
jgi:hypothetical protein